MPPAVSSPSPPATPPPTPTVPQLGAAYLGAATIFNKANRTAFSTWESAARTLTDAKRLARAYAQAELAFIRAVQAIPWYGDGKALARRVLTIDNLRYVAYRSAEGAGSWIEYRVSSSQAAGWDLKGTAASNGVRIALGLPPVGQPER